VKRLALAVIPVTMTAFGYAAPTTRDGLIWYYDPRLLTAEQRDVIEIARHYLDKNMPNDRAHHRYGGLIDTAGDSWEVEFARSSTDRDTSGPPDGDVVVYVDKKSKQVTHTLFGQ
jgi:hypothetical protein